MSSETGEALSSSVLKLNIAQTDEGFSDALRRLPYGIGGFHAEI